MNDMTNEVTTEPTPQQVPAQQLVFDTQSMRSAAITEPRKQENIATPFWSGTDGGIAIADVPIDELMLFNPMASTDQSAYSAALLARTLVNRTTGERIFGDADRDAIKAMGGSIVLSLMKPVNAFFGFVTKNAVEDAKKN